MSRADQLRKKADDTNINARAAMEATLKKQREEAEELGEHLARNLIRELDAQIEEAAEKGRYMVFGDLGDTEAGSFAASRVCQHFRKEGFKADAHSYKHCVDAEFGCYETGITVTISWEK